METLKQITRAITPRSVLTGTAALLALSGTAYTISIYQRMRLTDRSLITTADTASDSFRKSATIRSLVNPRGHTAWEDSRSMRLAIPSGAKPPSEEQLLSSFVRGFFGGRVFLPERSALQLLKWQLVVFDGLAPTGTPRHVNSAAELPASLPQLHSIFWGAFQVTDLHVGEDGTGSWIDFAYGSNRGEFAGCHRFTIRKGEGEVFVSMECITRSPKVDKPISGRLLSGFHKIYAMMLFRDAVAEVQSLMGC